MILTRIRLSTILCNRPSCMVRLSSTQSSSLPETDLKEPIKYSQSKAHKDWKSRFNWEFPLKEDRSYYIGRYAWITLWAAGLGTMLWSFFIAEPDDPKKPWLKQIWEIEPSLERPILERFLVDRARNGLPVKHIRDRLKELEAEGR